jgi:hypothetical protein
VVYLFSRGGKCPRGTTILLYVNIESSKSSLAQERSSCRALFSGLFSFSRACAKTAQSAIPISVGYFPIFEGSEVQVQH